MVPDTNAEAGPAPPLQLGLWDAAASEDWRVRESARARRLAARVFFDGRVEIVVPRGTRRAAIGRFVTRHSAWIERARRRVAQPRSGAAQTGGPWPPAELQLTALNERWACVYEPAAATTTVLEDTLAGPVGRLLLRGPGAAQGGQRAALLTWLRQRAADALLPMLRSLSIDMDCQFQRLQVRLQRTRWGSCSRQGTISVNACLLFQTPAVLRYLLVHELAHRRHMNHGPEFWKLVARHEPSWRMLDRELLHGWQRVPHWLLSRG